jgi:hypothetical protein
VTDFNLSQRFIINADFAFGCWHCVEVGSIADVSRGKYCPIFRVDGGGSMFL